MILDICEVFVNIFKFCNIYLLTFFFLFDKMVFPALNVVALARMGGTIRD